MSGLRNVWAVIPAAGSGSRMGAGLPKQYLELNGRTLLQHTLQRVLSYTRVKGLVLVVAANDRRWVDIVARLADDRLETVTGGTERFQSVLNGLRALRSRAQSDDWVMVHDAARPCVRHSDLDRLFMAIEGEPAGGLLGMRVRDTMKRSADDQHVTATVDREGLWHALTPQVFRYRLLLDALEQTARDAVLVTDEAAAMERCGYHPLMVEGRGDNLKVTRPEDLALASFYLRQQEEE